MRRSPTTTLTARRSSSSFIPTRTRTRRKSSAASRFSTPTGICRSRMWISTRGKRLSNTRTLRNVGCGTRLILLHRRAAIVASCTGYVMTDHTGLVRAEHVLTARSRTKRRRCYSVGRQRWADSRARTHGEGVPALHESRRGETREKLVDKTRLRGGAEGGRGTRCGRTTECGQGRGKTNLRKQRRVTNLSGVDRANRGGR